MECKKWEMGRIWMNLEEIGKARERGELDQCANN
jgi:hypothetical protein